jgi:hypothetical protein
MIIAFGAYLLWLASSVSRAFPVGPAYNSRSRFARRRPASEITGRNGVHAKDRRAGAGAVRPKPVLGAPAWRASHRTNLRDRARAGRRIWTEDPHRLTGGRGSRAVDEGALGGRVCRGGVRWLHARSHRVLEDGDSGASHRVLLRAKARLARAGSRVDAAFTDVHVVVRNSPLLPLNRRPPDVTSLFDATLVIVLLELADRRGRRGEEELVRTAVRSIGAPDEEIAVREVQRRPKVHVLSGHRKIEQKV